MFTTTTITSGTTMAGDYSSLLAALAVVAVLVIVGVVLFLRSRRGRKG
jgi:uncharacterized membrane protein